MRMLEDYRQEIRMEIERNPRDLAWGHRMRAVDDLERRVRLMAAGGLRVIQGGKED
jgi:hypothetical protein